MKWLKIGAVIFGAVLITALGIDAADTLSGSRATLLAQLIGSSTQGVCPKGMLEVPLATTFTCVDAFEASPGDSCPHANPQNEQQTQENLNDPSCEAISKEGSDAWRFITREQAFTACLRGGKRLPKSSEWYIASAGTPDTTESCNIQGSGPHRTGEHEACVSALGVYDAIGNVWEWTADDVIEGMLDGRTLPQTGYVTQVDANGVAVLSGTEASELFFEDYFWTVSSGVFGMIRGGFYGSKSDAGVYAIHADTPPTTSGTAIGFRCVL